MSDMNELWVGVGAVVAGTAYGLFVLAVGVVSEHVAPIERYTFRQRLPGTLMQIVGSPLSIMLVLPVQWGWQWLGLDQYLLPLWGWLSPLGVAGYVLQILIFVLVADFLRYWRHRAEHKWFWPIHAVHHAPAQLHAANSLGHPLQVLPEMLMVTLPLSIIQFGGYATPVAVAFVLSLFSQYIHSPIDIHFGPARCFMVDNRYHRIHHSLEERHFDKNYGICFSLWDRMFGTAYWPEPNEWPRVGVAGVSGPKDVKEFLLFPWFFDRSSSKKFDQHIHSMEHHAARPMAIGDPNWPTSIAD